MNPLEHKIQDLICREGPISLETYMALALADPEYGYYMTRDPFGAQGDFTTAPEISQIFGELLGLWSAELWLRAGCPNPVALVELGPGRGTLMKDALRATRNVPGFHEAIHVTLVETSPVLRAAQAKTLEGAHPRIGWASDVSDLPSMPVLVLANEFFDALPIRQYELRNAQKFERLVGLDDTGHLTFVLDKNPYGGALDGREGSISETCPIGIEIMTALSTHIASRGGGGLIIDYGDDAGEGDTLQALKAHAFVDPLTDPGAADLTAHVRFSALADAAQEAGLVTQGPITQARLLGGLGLEARAHDLLRQANPRQAQDIESAVKRLIDPSPKGMGALFKVLAFRNPAWPIPAVFQDVDVNARENDWQKDDDL